MTATYPSTHGMWDCTHTQRREWLDLPASRCEYFSRILADAGYTNAYFGKWHVEQSERLEDFGWHEYDLACAHVRARPIPGSTISVAAPGYPDYLLAGTARDEDTATHPAFDRGIDFLRRHAANQPRRPFCCFVSASEPHDPYIAPERYLRLYDADRVPLSPTLRASPDGKPEIVRRMRAVWDTVSDADWRRIVAAHYGVVSFLDAEVGRLLAELERLGLERNTIVVFTSDHGDMLGGHGLVAKGGGTPYEEVYNIPLILRAPGLPAAGEEGGAVAGMVDIAPTLLDLCGCPPLPRAQGRSLRPVLERRANPDDWQDAYAEFYGQRFVYTQRITWHREWKYVFSPAGIDELYNLAADPNELVNRAQDPAFRGVLHDMVRRMWRTMKRLGDDSLFNSQYATLRTAPIGPDSVRDTGAS